MQTDKNIEEFAKNILKEADLESPSPNFVNEVMASLEAKNEVVTERVDKPLISKLGWFFIIATCLVLSLYLLLSTSSNNVIASYLDISQLSFSFFEDIGLLNIFENIKLSKTFTYSFMIFSVMVLLQIFMIRNYVDKRNMIQ